jgi:glycosyltransferase involved in cell wall biosynthesis
VKILHFIYDHVNNPWVGGGGAVRALEIYRRLSGRHQITVVSGTYPGAKDYSEGALEFHFVGTERNNYFLSTFCYSAKAARFLNNSAESADVIVEDFAPWNPVFSFRHKKKAAVVLQIQSYLGPMILRKYLLFGIPFFLIEKFYPNFFDHFIFISPSVGGKNASRSAVISNGIDETLLRLSPSEENYIGYLGRIDIHTKGLDTLVKAVNVTPVSLKVAGVGKDISVFLRLIEGKKNIEWVGALNGSSKEVFLGGMKLLVLPSRFEGQGIVVLEAAASGKPVIVSDVPGLRYAVEGGFGLAFRTGDAKDLAEKIGTLLADRELRRTMGMRAREYAQAFSWNKIAHEYERYLVGVQGENSGGAG